MSNLQKKMPIAVKRKKLSRQDQSAARLENFRKEVVTDCHLISLTELCTRFKTDPAAGLSPEQAKEILKRDGYNVLTPSRQKSELLKFILSLFKGFSILLWIGALLCFISALVEVSTKDKLDYNNLVLGVVLIMVIIITGFITYYQERKSRKIMTSFATMIPQKATVIRGGTVMILNSKEVVVGDLVELKFGDRVPADLRIINAQGLKVDNSPITGEAEALPRGTESNQENLLEAANVVFFSTNVVEGVGRGIVISCGDHTVMGHIAGLTARLTPNKTPMAKELTHFMTIITMWAITLGVLLAIACFFLGYSIIKTLLFSIGIIVANIPEGLLITVVICLTAAAKKMAEKNCMVKKLESVETLGCTSVICSDKTGTLTLNQMTVCHLWFNSKIVQANFEENLNEKAYRDLIRCATLCNRAEFFPEDLDKPIKKRRIRGDASESAILKYINISTNVLGSDFRQRNPKMVEIPFSSTTKFQISVHRLENERYLVVMKGAPEVVLQRCAKILMGNEDKILTRDLLDVCNEACLTFAEMGERVLGFCDLELDGEFKSEHVFTTEPVNFPQRGLRFLGLMAMIDPPRPQVPEAIRRCKEAGIKVIMVTGDHPITAKAIATQVGLVTQENVRQITNVKEIRTDPYFYNATIIPRNQSGMIPVCTSLVIHGEVLLHLLQDELDTILYNHKEIVFARTSPTQKLQIVEGYQRLGEIVAVTGDGVNDAPALKKSDIGVAMGITGTEVAQEASDIILLDDNFASIIHGIEEGRKIFDNLKKSITYTLASNMPEIIPLVMYTFVGIPQPMGVIAILCIDLITDMLPAISLAYEKAESDIMLRPPRNPLRDRLVNRKLYFLAYGHLGLIETLAVFFVYFVVMAEHGFMPSNLIGLREQWEENSENMTDYYGRKWTYGQRIVLSYKCNSACFTTVVVTQWFNLIACKTRLNSIAQQGMENKCLNIALIVETSFTCALIYIPYMYYLEFVPISWRTWLYALSFAGFVILFDELRKWHIRKYRRGWYQRETFY